MDESLSYSPEGFPWPAENDKLISKEGHRIYLASLLKTSDLVAHIEGYKRAGDLVWATIQADPRMAGIDFLVHPMIFLYRHFVELSIKDIISLARRIQSEPGLFPMHHRISELWTEARRLISEIEPEGSQDDLNAMTVLVAQLAKIDPDSFAFRYPITKDLKPTLPDDSELNLETFHEGIEKMANWFGGVRCQFDHYWSNMPHDYY